MVKRVLLFIIVLCGFYIFPFQTFSGEEEDFITAQKTSMLFSRVAKRAMPTVVFIKVEKSIGDLKYRNPSPYNNPYDLFDDELFKRFFGPQFPGRQNPSKEHKQTGQGSGFIISGDGYILTNHHVVGDADKITVTLKDGRDFTAKLIGTDDKSDVALIKIESKEEFPFLPLGNSDSLDVGHWVIAIGNPFGLSHTMTVGVVSAKGRTNVGLTDYENFIQTDAAINPGNSGGPLINLKGEVIGINSAIFSRSGGYMGIGFAIPINMAKDIEKQLITKGKVTRGFLGVMIQDIDENLAHSFNLKSKQGIIIADVTDDSPAGKGGLKRGDVVISFDGKAVNNVGQFRNRVALTRPDKKVEITVIRDGKKKNLSVRIGTLEGQEVAGVSSGVVKKLGIAVKALTEPLAEKYNYEMERGVIVSGVQSGSIAQLAGIRPGMLILEVNRKKIKTVGDFTRALKKGRKSFLLLVKDGKHTSYVSIRLS